MAESACLSGDGKSGKMSHEHALVALRGAGLVVTAENPQDGRRLLYHLAPAIPATKTERGWEMDFGYCLVRG
jgi:hypothetical protein